MGNESSAPANNPRPHGQIGIDIVARPNRCGTVVKARGYRTSVIDDDDCEAFRMTPNKLKRAVEEFHGKRPTDVFVKSPTPWDDLYTKHDDWYPVEKTVKVVSAKVIDAECTTVGVATRRYINNSDEIGTFNTSFTETATNTVSSTWSAEFSCNSGIKYDLKFPGSVNLEYTAKCGCEVNRSKTVTIAAQSSVNVTLAPGRSVIVHLRSRKNTIYVKVKYEISLEGDVVCNYYGGYKGSSFWALDVNRILEAVDKPTVLETEEVLELTYYSDGEIELDRVNHSCSSTEGYCMRHGVPDYNVHSDSDDD